MAVSSTGLVGLGPAPVVKSATANCIAGTNTSVVSAVAGKCISVLAITASANTTAATLIDLRDGASTVKWHFTPVLVGAISVSAPAGGYLFRGTTNTALNLYGTGATSNCVVSVSYIEEDP